MSIVKRELQDHAYETLRRLGNSIENGNKEDVKNIIELINSPELKKYPYFSINNPLEGHFFGSPDYAITLAAKHGDAEMLKLVIDAGADLQARGHYDKDAFALIIEQSTYGDHAEERALCDKKLEMIKLLMDAGYDIEAKDKFGYTALHHVIKEKDNRLFDAVMERSPNVNALKRDKESALLMAVEAQSAYKVKKLIEAGAKPDLSNSNRRDSELSAASYQGNIEIATMLIDAGAKVNPTATYDGSPLYYSRTSWKKSKEMETLLMKSGAKEKGKVEEIAERISQKFDDMAKKSSERKEQKKEAKLQANEAIRKLNSLKR